MLTFYIYALGVQMDAKELLEMIYENDKRGFRSYPFIKDENNYKAILNLLKKKYVYSIGLTFFLTERGLDFLTSPGN
jgi:hypothetical protein